MVNGFSIELNINGIILEYDENTGMISCDISRQSSPSTDRLSFGIVSQSASIVISDINSKMKKLFLRGEIKNAKVKIYFNNNIVFYGIVKDNKYDIDSSEITLNISDMLILLVDAPSYGYVGTFHSASKLLHGLITRINEFYTKNDINIDIIIENTIMNRCYSLYVTDGYCCIKGNNIWEDIDNFCNAFLCNVYIKDNKIYFANGGI